MRQAYQWLARHRKTKYAVAIWLAIELISLIALFFEVKFLT